MTHSTDRQFSPRRFAARLGAVALMVAASASLALAAPASAGPNHLGQLTGSVVGSAGTPVMSPACPGSEEDPTPPGPQQTFSGTVMHQGRPEQLVVVVCVVCCHPGGRSLNGSFEIKTPGGTVTGTITDGHEGCPCNPGTSYDMNLVSGDGTRGLKKTDGTLHLNGTFADPDATEGALANATLTVAS